jgi:4-alpha-glucanotransferase
MSATMSRVRVTDGFGIDSGYFDIAGRWWDTLPETRRALIEAMGLDPESPEPPPARVEVLVPGRTSSLRGPAEILLEDGTTLDVGDELPSDLPFGYHEWRPRAGAPVRLIVSPGRCVLDEGLRAWGWAVQLYALRSAGSWGMGDLADLRELAAWSHGQGAQLLLINPMGAALPFEQQDPSPYFPSSRRYRNPLYLRVEEAAGAAQAGPVLEAAAVAGRALNGERTIDRAAVFRAKMRALETLYERFGGAPSFDRYCRQQGAALEEFATFCVLAETHGSGWPGWPEAHRRPGTEAVRTFAADNVNRVRFHQWLQWLIDEQLRAAGREVRIMHDLPIGVDPAGADAWSFQDVLAPGVRVGAPPDEFAAQGQDWGLPPFVPHKLRAAAYDPFIQVIRASLRHAGGLRIDHVMGLFRLFWIPAGRSPKEGGYVRYAADELLAIVALESHRAGAIVCGEDLGTVEEGVRETLADHRVLSYRVLWFEPQPPPSYPRLALSAATTHDLPTIAGLWTGADLDEQKALGTTPNEDGTRRIRDQVGALTGLGPDADPQDVVVALHKLLGEAPSLFVTATLEDALLVRERPNIPGTAGQRANWSLALPATLEELRDHPLAAKVADVLRSR